ncbi:L,D-transpeptidase family protein [Roseisolibacter agri]|uniref:Peptidoglycan-binding protein n=1 Tax=Roseisolibacter agri TaxID=2014610 RepID=A0AA37Q5T1_9BACT|nr:L,D-transpeptidase [Roseisolibacter agri]GLC25192.1 peptidoglycan-binding protein [Roseisolibacter agri]
MLPPVVRALLALLALSAVAAPALAAAQPPADTTRRPPAPDTLRVDSVRADSARRDSLRLDTSRMDSVRVDSAPPADRAAAPRASWLAAEAVRAPVRLPVSGGTGPRVLHVQVLLGAAGFSPGVLDGRWQAGTRAAVRAFRKAHGLGAGEAVNADTYARLVAAAQERPTLVDYRISRDDLRAPLRKIPAGYHDKAKLEWLGYETVAERLAERFHTTPIVLKELNPGVDLEKVVPGTVLVVPNVWRLPPRAAPARLVVDKRLGMLHGYDADGGLLFALRASVGSTQTPSPTGLLKVRSITRYPWYQYNPRVLAGDASVKGRTADLPPGPNSPVGVVWIQLSKAHIGIHGTPEPARVGSGQSHGCVRLTNWDALFLASALAPGVEVEFL